ncbi:MAG: hypothetical protein HY914_04080 [Desulfomonile tiedjei]|nr:hypothetical protein [Desulfomonile tiedjei]
MSRPQEPPGQAFGAEDQVYARSPRRCARRGDLGFALGTMGATLCALLIVILFSNLPLNLDCALFLDCARKLVRGGIPYVDCVDVNPPMSFYIHIPAVFVSDLFGMDGTIVFHLMVAALIAYSSGMLLHLLLRLYPSASIPVLLVVTTTWISFSVYVVCFGWFGEREQLFMLAYVPFLFCRQARHVGAHVGSTAAAVIGAILGPFALVKPHFCVIALAVEAWMLFRTRRFSSLLRAEALLAVGWGVAYAVSFAVAPAEMKEAFWGRWLPFVARNYNVFDLPLKDFALRGLPALPHYVPLALMSLPACVFIARKFSSGARLNVEALVVGTLAAYGMFLIQHKGWPYQVYPMLGFSFLLAGIMAMAAIEPASVFAEPTLKEPRGLRSALLAVICSVLIAGSCLVAAHRLSKRDTVRSETDPFIELIEKYSSPDERVAWISPSLNPGTQAVIYAKRISGSRFSGAWPLAMLYKDVSRTAAGPFPYRTMKQAPEEERLFLSDLGTDMQRNRPRLVFIHAVDAPTTRPAGFIMEEYLQKNGWMKEYMSNYAFLVALNGYSVYRLED